MVGEFRVPSRITVYAPSQDLHLDLKFKTWKQIEQAPDVFSPEPPEKYEVISFEQFLQSMGNTMGTEGAEGVVNDAVGGGGDSAE